MTGRSLLADDAKRRMVLADMPKRRVDPNRVAGALGAAEAMPAPPGCGSPVRWYVARKAALKVAARADWSDQ